MKGEDRIKNSLEEILDKDEAIMLNRLKELAFNVEITGRKEFENRLLTRVQKIIDEKKRSSIYEVLVSLHTIWNQFQPVQRVQEKFRAAFAAGNYKEAEENYIKLARQGLDYLGTFELGEGDMVPLITEEYQLLVHFNKKEITFYSLQLEPINKIFMPDSWEIITAHAPFKYQSGECRKPEQKKEPEQPLPVLLKDKDENKGIGIINLSNINSKEKDNNLEVNITTLDNTLKDVIHLSCFQNHLLLLSKNRVYYLHENGNWQDWYRTEHEITAFASTREGFWVGHDNGDVFILKSFEHVGNREVFREFSDSIHNILNTGRFVLISDKDCLRISDYGGNQVSQPIETQCKILHASTLSDEFFLLLQANGMFTAREMNQKNIRWQMNLGEVYDRMISLKDYLYCINRKKIMMFEIPHYHIMAKELESQNIHVENLSIEIDPNAPIRYISDFIGRKDILMEIREKYNDHFILYGPPRIGKTSLLNILRDALADKARCCVIDWPQFLKGIVSYEDFENKFIDRCLGQHFMKKSDLPNPNDYHYQILRTMIEKIKGSRSFFIFGLDNFFIPSDFGEEDKQKFESFLKSLFIHPGTRIIFTCSSKRKEDLLKYFESIDIQGKQKKMLVRQIPFLSEGEVRNALRKKISLQQSIVDEIYRYTGRFPHLIHLYDRWKPGESTIDEQSGLIAKAHCEKIFEYFRDLSQDARILIATCLHENLMGEKINFKTFYEKFHFFQTSLNKGQLEKVLKEINGYGDGITAQADEETFLISLEDSPFLFHEAAKHIPWYKNFKALFDFISLPTQVRAHWAAKKFVRITKSELDSDELLEKKTEKYKDKFYVGKLTEKGMQNLKMPLTTFIVIPLQPWQKETHVEAFFDLNLEFQEFNRKAGEADNESAGSMFYILLFDLLGGSMEKIREDLEGMERISIVDTNMMKNIILADTPQEKASQYIFDQLSIRERSPYTTAGAVPDSLFYGRQMEINLIRGLPENIGIFGTRTIGKTSLLRRLHKHFQSQVRWKVYDMDCARIESEEVLLKNLAEKMEVPFEEISDMEKFRRYVTRQAETGGHRYLFLLDEVDRLVEYDIGHDEKIFNTFNRLCNETMKNNETAARFILFGFQQMFEQMKNPLSRLYNFMVFLPLQALDPEGAMSLVIRPIENIRVNWKDREDAKYLVDRCSRHPRLLQTACHALLTHLDSKGEKRDIIERSDVDRALNSQDFREICMRYYQDQNEDKNNNSNNVQENKKRAWPFSLFQRKHAEKNEKEVPNNSEEKRKEFLSDLHRITILSAIRLLFEEKKEHFTITDIQEELKKNDIGVSPNAMRNVLDQLCLSGNFRLRDESAIIARHEIKIPKETEKNNSGEVERVAVQNPDEYVGDDTVFPKFTFEFGVKIFPKLLVAHFGGLDQCKEERKKLIEKGNWQEWLRRF